MFLALMRGGCLTFAFGLFHEQEQVVEGAQVPAVRGADEEEGTAEAGSQRWPCVGCVFVQWNCGRWGW